MPLIRLNLCSLAILILHIFDIFIKFDQEIPLLLGFTIFRTVSELARGHMSSDSEAFIKELSCRPYPENQSVTTLCGTNAECDVINNKHLNTLPGMVFYYVSRDSGNKATLDQTAPHTLCVKVGAKVILLI